MHLRGGRAHAHSPSKAPQGPIAQAVELLNHGRPRKAAKKLRPLLHSSDSYTNAAAHFYGGYCLLQLKKYKKAGKIWTSIALPSSSQRNTAYYYYAARIATVKLYLDHHLKPPKSGMDAVGRSLKHILNAPPLSAVQSRAAAYLGRYAERKHLDKQAIAFYKKGIALLKNLPANSYDPAGLRSTMLKGLSGRIRKIKKRMARRAAAKRKRASRTSNQVAAQQAVLKAKNEAVANNYSDAIKNLRRAIRLAPNGPNASGWRYRMGGYYIQSGAYRQGFAYWDRFIDQDPTGPYRAQALLDMADYFLFKKYNLNRSQDKLDVIGKSIRYIVAKNKDDGRDARPTGRAGVSPAVVAQPRKTTSKSGKQNGKKNKTSKENKTSKKKPANPYHLFLLSKVQFKSLPASWQQAYCSLLRRRGLINWVYGYPKRGAALMEASTKYKPSAANDFSDARSFAGKRMKWLIDRMKSGRMKVYGRPIPVGHAHHPRAGVAILLGEIYFGAVKLKPAARYFADVAHSKGRLHPSRDQRAFAYIRLGQCAKLHFDMKTAYKYYQAVLEDSQLKHTSWASSASLQSALLIYQNNNHNWHKAAEMLHEIYKDHPRSWDAPNALYYEATLYAWYGQPEEAEKIFKTALRFYSSQEDVKKMLMRGMSRLEKNKKK